MACNKVLKLQEELRSQEQFHKHSIDDLNKRLQTQQEQLINHMQRTEQRMQEREQLHKQSIDDLNERLQAQQEQLIKHMQTTEQHMQAQEQTNKLTEQSIKFLKGMYFFEQMIAFRNECDS